MSVVYTSAPQTAQQGQRWTALFVRGGPAAPPYPYAAPSSKGAVVPAETPRQGYQNAAYPTGAAQVPRTYVARPGTSQEAYYTQNGPYGASVSTFNGSTDSLESSFEDSLPQTPVDPPAPGPLNFHIPLPPASQADSDRTLRGDDGPDPQHNAAHRHAMVVPEQTREFLEGAGIARSRSRRDSTTSRYDFPTMPAPPVPRTISKSGRDNSPPRARPTAVPVRRGSADEEVKPRPMLPSRSNSAPPNVLRKPHPVRREAEAAAYHAVNVPSMVDSQGRAAAPPPPQPVHRERRPSVSATSPTNGVPPMAFPAVPPRERRPSMSAPANAVNQPTILPRERRPSFSTPSGPQTIVPPRAGSDKSTFARPESHRLLSDTTVMVAQEQRGQRPQPPRSQSDPLPVGAANRGPTGRVRWKENLICPSPIWPSQRRQGFWNKRGDQLWTNDGGYRGPQPGQEYPLELAEYPDYGEGWMNEEGTRIDMQHRLVPKVPNRPALKRR